MPWKRLFNSIRRSCVTGVNGQNNAALIMQQSAVYCEPIGALNGAFVLYKASRYDVKGKSHLKSLEKYYLVDVGLRRMLLGDKNPDIGHILEPAALCG